MAGLLVMLSIAPMGVVKEPSMLPRLTIVVGVDFLAFGVSTFLLISAGMKGELSQKDLKIASWSTLIGVITAMGLILVLTVIAYIYDLFSQFTITTLR